MTSNSKEKLDTSPKESPYNIVETTETTIESNNSKQFALDSNQKMNSQNGRNKNVPNFPFPPFLENQNVSNGFPQFPFPPGQQNQKQGPSNPPDFMSFFNNQLNHKKERKSSKKK